MSAVGNSLRYIVLVIGLASNARNNVGCRCQGYWTDGNRPFSQPEKLYFCSEGLRDQATVRGALVRGENLEIPKFMQSSAGGTGD